MTRPKVSIIVPNYNHEAFLPKRLDSILNQTYKDYEVILLDDHSTDNSLSVLKTYEGIFKECQLITNDQNSGSPFLQWRKGLNFAKGEYIWIAESDDFAAPDFLETCVATLRQNERLTLAFTQSYLVDDIDSIKSLNPWGMEYFEKNKDLQISNGLTFSVSKLLYKNVIPNASAVVFKASKRTSKAVDDILGYKYTGDWLFWSKISLEGDICFINKPLNNFRFHSQSTRNNLNIQTELERFKEIFKIIDFNKKNSNIQTSDIIFTNYKWLFSEWITKKSAHNVKDMLALFKILPRYFIIPYTKVLGQYMKERIAKKLNFR